MKYEEIRNTNYLDIVEKICDLLKRSYEDGRK